MKTTIYLAIIFCFFGTSSPIFGQQVTINNNLKVESDGTLVFNGDATIWDDLMVYPDATTKSGSYSPTWARFGQNGSSQGVFLWMFDPSTEQELYFTVQIPHSYKESSTIYPHVHWTTTTGTPSGTNVVWGLEYTIMKIGGTFSTTTTIITANTVISSIGTPTGTAQHLITSFGGIGGGAIEISTVLICRLFRKTADSNDTFANTVGLLGFDIHYERDTEGSRTQFTK